MQAKELLNMVTPFQNKLYRYAVRIVGDHMDAEDVLQELLVKLWKKKDHFVTIDNKEAWCMTLTRNLSIDKIRKRKFRTDNIEDFHFIKNADPSPHVQLQSDDNMHNLINVINTLPERQKAVIHLRDVEGYSYKEISEITGYKSDQVKVYLHRARQKLRKIITRSDYE